jgi:hypothetical protein
VKVKVCVRIRFSLFLGALTQGRLRSFGHGDSALPTCGVSLVNPGRTTFCRNGLLCLVVIALDLGLDERDLATSTEL